MYQSQIIGAGHYVPDNVVTNHDLEKLMNTTDEWIVERTGIKERRYFTEGKDTTSLMGKKAAEQAIQHAGIKTNEIEMIIFATLSPDYYFPGCGVLLQKELGLPHIAALDVRNQCSGFIYALSVADQFIKTGMYTTILVVGAETQSNFVEYSDRHRHVAVIFGDGAGALVLQRSKEPNKGILSTHLYSDGSFAEELFCPHPGTRLKTRITPEMLTDGSLLAHMNGSLVFKHAVTRFEECITQAVASNGYTVDDLDLLIPHQANLRIAEYITRKFQLPAHKVFNNIQKYGNTTAASIPIALSEAWAEGKIQPNQLVCMAAFGSGFTWASALVRI
jgi:3-oxoacyl-[acyl-carrier-protein] synthase-3